MSEPTFLYDQPLRSIRVPSSVGSPQHEIFRLESQSIIKFSLAISPTFPPTLKTYPVNLIAPILIPILFFQYLEDNLTTLVSPPQVV